MVKPYSLRLLIAWLLLLTFYLTGCTGDITAQPVHFRPTMISSSPPVQQPAIRISPSQGYAGTSIQVEGSGWPGNTLVLVALSDAMGRSGILAAGSTDASGTMSASFTYPTGERWIAAGTHTVVAYTANLGRQATAEFEAVPDLAPTPVIEPDLTATAPVTATITTPTPSPTPTPTAQVITEWRGDYWSNPNLQGEPALTRSDATVAFNWGTESPAAEIPADDFSARWVRTLSFEPGVYRFNVEVDDGVRLYLDNTLIIDEWRVGSPRTTSVDYPVTAGEHTLKVEYFERTERALVRLWWERQTIEGGWRGEYFAGANLEGIPILVREDTVIDFEWGSDELISGFPAQEFSVRWQRMVDLSAGRYRFFARGDDGLRFWIDGELFIDSWQEGTGDVQSVDIDLPSGRYQLIVEYYNRSGDAGVQFRWEALSDAAALGLRDR